MAVYLTHFWVGNKTGYVTSTALVGTKPNCPITKSKDRLKYLGFSATVGWPKVLNTGRLLRKPSDKAYAKQQKR